MKQIRGMEMIGKILKNTKYTMVYITVLLLFFAFVLHRYRDYTVAKAIGLVFFIMFVVGFVCIYKWRENIGANIHKIYRIVGLCFGLIYLVMIPVYCVPDEQIHYWATYNLSNQVMGIGTGDDGTVMMRADDVALPVKVEYKSREEYDAYLVSAVKGIRVSDNKMVDSGYLFKEASISYCYVVPMLGILLGRILGLGAVYVFWLGRFFNLLIFVFGMSYAIKKTPIAKMGFFAIGLFPIVLQQAASYSHDMVINLLSFMVIAISLSFYLTEIANRRLVDYIVYAISLGLLIPLKGYSYAIFLAFPIWIIIKDFKANKRVDRRMIIPLAIPCLYNVLLVIYRHLGLTKTQSVTSSSIFGDHIISWCGEPGYSIQMFIDDPALLISIIYNTAKKYFGTFWLDAIGHALGWLNIEIPMVLSLIWVLLIALMFVKRKEENLALSGVDKLFFTALSVCVSGIVIADYYLHGHQLSMIL